MPPTLVCNTKSPWTPRCLLEALEGKWTQPKKKKWCWAQITSIYINKRTLLGQAQYVLVSEKCPNHIMEQGKLLPLQLHGLCKTNSIVSNEPATTASACSYNGQCTPAPPIGLRSLPRSGCGFAGHLNLNSLPKTCSASNSSCWLLAYDFVALSII